MSSCYALIDDAIRSGTNAVKFQAYSVKDLNEKHTNYQRYKECNISVDKMKELKGYCDTREMKFYTSAFSIEVLPYLASFTDTIKVPSTFLTYEAFVKLCIHAFKEIHISTGMHDMSVAMQYLDKYADLADKAGKTFIPYHCVSLYPTPPALTRMCRLKVYKTRYGRVGYSDHSIGNKAPLLAYHYGASHIEKHFVLNNATTPWAWTDLELSRFRSDLSFEKDMIKDSLLTDQEVKNFTFYKDEFQGLRKCHLQIVSSS